ncbi:MAG: hypothetical protein V4608_07120 [Bacteroidota bacterium]
MFDFFKRKPKLVDYEDIVWITEPEKQQGVLEIIKKNPDVLILSWFSETQESFKSYLTKNHLSNSVNLIKPGIGNTTHSVILFLEHYPILSTEQELLKQFSTQKIIFATALSDPLIMEFGGEGLVKLTKMLDLKEGESIQHKMISKSIRGAQEKVEQKTGNTLSYYAKSSNEWFHKYYKKE